MCGIAGFECGDGWEGAAKSLERSLANRGPDGSWTKRVGRYCLVQTRLAVIDRSPRVVYPMPNETEDLWLLFNGEIYEYPRLQEELRSRGHEFRTRCDAEVVLHAYEEWGLDAFPRLNGMFALVLIDERRDELVLTRDRFGIKPLLKTTGARSAFGSDALALVQSGLSGGEIDESSLSAFIDLHYLPPPLTGLTDVQQLVPGSAVVRRSDGTESCFQWAVPTFANVDRTQTAPGLEDLDRALARAVSNQLVADVDVGVFLSGGIDSALLASYAVAAGAKPVAFTVGFSSYGDYDESRRAAETALHLGLEHHVEQFEMGFTEAIDLVTGAFDLPLADASAIATLVLARLARSSVTVALSGTGGDELFAGYYRHRAHRLRGVVRRLPAPLRMSVTSMAAGRSAARQSSLRQFKSYAVRLASGPAESVADQYIELVAGATSSQAEQGLNFSVDREASRERLFEGFPSLTNSVEQPLDAVQDFDLRTYLPGDLLYKEDRATMRLSLEARVPLLDQGVVDIARLLPPAQRAGLLVGKLPLRRIGRRRLSQGSRTWQKRGFAVPLGQLLSNRWKPEAVDWFRQLDSSLVDGRRVSELIRGAELDPADIWALAVLAGWEGRTELARRESSALRHPGADCN